MTYVEKITMEIKIMKLLRVYQKEAHDFTMGRRDTPPDPESTPEYTDIIMSIEMLSVGEPLI